MLATSKYKTIGFVFWVAIASFVAATVLILGLLQAAVMTWASTRQIATLQLAQTDISADRVADSLRITKSLIRQLSAQTYFSRTDTSRMLELRRLLALEPNLRKISFRFVASREQYTANRFGMDEVRQLEPAEDAKTSAGKGHDEVYFGEVLYKDNITPVVPFHHSKPAAFIASGEVALTALTDALFELKLNGQSLVYVIDADARIIADRNLARALTRDFTNAVKPTSKLLWKTLGSAGPAGTWFTEGDDGSIALVSTSKIGGTPWRLIIERPARDVLAPLRETLFNVVFFTLTALLLGVGVARWLSKRIARPIVEMKFAADKIAGGDFDVSLAGGPSIELQSLAGSIELMARELKSAQLRMETEIKRQTAEANRANQHKSDFLAHMSHELRTPLNAVIGFSEMLDARYFGPLTDKQAEYIKDIHLSGQHLLALINDILDLAKVESGRMELVLANADISALVESCRTLTAERFLRKRQRLEIRLDLGQTHWVCDARKVKQSIINLLSNANKFTAEDKRVTLAVSSAPGALVIKVEDEGVGIPPDALPHLFSDFFQVIEPQHSGGRRDISFDAQARPDGTGLGLALTKRFVELHGGTIGVDTEVGRGSVFTITLPPGPESI